MTLLTELCLGCEENFSRTEIMGDSYEKREGIPTVCRNRLGNPKKNPIEAEATMGSLI
jgi:hypothetical protein